MEIDLSGSSEINGQKLKFPVSFDLKVIMEAREDQENQAALTDLFKELQIPFRDWDIRESSGGKYRRYSVNITLITRRKMDILYGRLSEHPMVKTAL